MEISRNGNHEKLKSPEITRNWDHKKVPEIRIIRNHQNWNWSEMKMIDSEYLLRIFSVANGNDWHLVDFHLEKHCPTLSKTCLHTLRRVMGVSTPQIRGYIQGTRPEPLCTHQSFWECTQRVPCMCPACTRRVPPNNEWTHQIHNAPTKKEPNKQKRAQCTK